MKDKNLDAGALSTRVPGAAIPLTSLPNLRDLGGYETVSGRYVRTGVLYRSVALDKLAEDDARVLEGFGIRTVFDLRTAAERGAAPDRPIGDAHEVVCDVLADAAGAGTGAAAAEMLQVVRDPKAAMRTFGDGKAETLFEDTYRQIVSSGSALQAYGAFFHAIADDAARPALFHCTTGKDRTGWAAAAILLLLGVDETQVLRDYEATNRDLLPVFHDLFEDFVADGGDPAVLRSVLGVEVAYLQTALEEMRTRFGTIEGYFAEGLGIDDAGQENLRAGLTDYGVAA